MEYVLLFRASPSPPLPAILSLILSCPRGLLSLVLHGYISSRELAAPVGGCQVWDILGSRDFIPRAPKPRAYLSLSLQPTRSPFLPLHLSFSPASPSLTHPFSFYYYTGSPIRSSIPRAFSPFPHPSVQANIYPFSLPVFLFFTAFGTNKPLP